MPATSCDDTRPVSFTINGECDFTIAWTWDGTSTPPRCNGTVDGISWVNRSGRTYYAHMPATRNGPFTQPIAPNSSGSVTGRGQLNNAGLQTLDDVRQVGVDLIP